MRSPNESRSHIPSPRKRAVPRPPLSAAGKALNRGLTLLELLVVILILGILSTIATGVFIGQTERARIAATQDLLRELNLGAARYQIDTGQWPASGSATDVTISGSVATFTGRTRTGAGLLHLSLVHSLSGSAFTPFPSTWNGPYIEFRASQLSPSQQLGNIQILDPFLNFVQYVNSDDFADGTTFVGTELFPGARPVTANTDLPANSPFAATETFYNPFTIQLYSPGSDGSTAADPFAGTEIDDINNFGY